MAKNNFICPNCKFTKYVVIYSFNGKIYKDKYGDEIICKLCGTKMISRIIYKGFGINFGKFASGSPEQKREVLKKRSQKHFQKHIKDRQREEDLSHIKKKK